MIRDELRVCHLTTVHPATDVRIYFRECRSIADKTKFSVTLAANGQVEGSGDLTCLNLGEIPKNRLLRLVRSQIIAFRTTYRVQSPIWHIHDPELLLIALWLILIRKKVIWDAHEDYFLQFSKQVNYRKYIPHYLTGFINWGVTHLLRSVEVKCYGVICATPSIASKYKNLNTVVVGNESRIEEFISCSPKFTSKRVLFTGATDETQCFNQVVDAISRFPTLTLAVAGRLRTTPDWTQAQSILGDRLIHLGWLSRKELASAIDESFLGCLTYENSETNMTNSPNKLFEFSAGALPCISTPTKANIEWIKNSNGGYCLEGFSGDDIANGIQKALESELAWEAKSKASRDWCLLNGNWLKSEKVLIDFYNKLLTISNP